MTDAKTRRAEVFRWINKALTFVLVAALASGATRAYLWHDKWGRPIPEWLANAPQSREVPGGWTDLDVSRTLRDGMSAETLQKRLKRDGFEPDWGSEDRPFGAVLSRSNIACGIEWHVSWRSVAGIVTGQRAYRGSICL